MAPIPDNEQFIKDLIQKNKVMMFSKSYCPFCKKIKELFVSLKITFEVLELDQIPNGEALHNVLIQLSGQKTVPNVFINGQHIGGADDTEALHKRNGLLPMIQSGNSFEYDLVVIGGGSGGLAASKEAADLGAKVAVFDFVSPTPQGTTWGLGGTCVNVGCIPKKLMHQAALLRSAVEDSRAFGWELGEKVEHKWDKMRDAIQNHIASLNWGYRVSLRDKKVNYVNATATFTGPNQIKATDKKGKVTETSARNFIIATGERPRYPEFPGAKENCITSDDLFSLPYCPGKTLVIGASYVSLECAGFLAGLGLDVTVMVRSILLRGFDQQMAELVGDGLSRHHVKFIRGYVPSAVERLEAGQPGKLRVKARPTAGGDEISDEYDTVMLAIGRDPCTRNIGLEEVGVQLDKNGYVLADDGEQTSVPHIYAIGDIVSEKPKLTPVAIQAGRLLAQRMFSDKTELTDYINVATTVFTPLEYGCIGYSEEDAITKFGQESIEIFHSNFKPLEWTVPGHGDNDCYAKLVCNKSDSMRVVGFHVIGPNAGEVTQGFALGMRLGATKRDFDMTIGIHPTNAEIFTTLSVTKSSGESSAQSGC